MAVTNNNLLQTVATYNESSLALLQNMLPWLDIANTEYNEFNKLPSNLGSSVTYDKAPRLYPSTGSLVWQPQGISQRVQTLTVDQPFTVSYEFSSEQLIFQVDKINESYLPRIMTSGVASLANQMGTTIAKVANCSVTNNYSGSATYGQPNYKSGPTRVYNPALAQINSYQQLARAVANMREIGSVFGDVDIIIPNVAEPGIVNSALAQFALKRNDEIANSWYVGDWGDIRIWKSNTLPTQIAGNVGNNAQTLTVISTNDSSGANITQITFSGASASDPNAIFYGDNFTSVDGVSGQPNLRFLTWTGVSPTSQPVQFIATAQAGSNGSTNVVVNIEPGLTVGPSQTDNWSINTNIVAGMQFTVAASHICGLIIQNKALMVAMPPLGELPPYTTYVSTDERSKISMRTTHGAYLPTFGNAVLTGHDLIGGISLTHEDCMQLAFPLAIA